MNEFDIIEKYFAPLTQGRQALDDDAAMLHIPTGHELVVTSDTLNAGTHFMEDAAPADVAGKALRVSLSDLAAMGAIPLSYQLNIAFPDRPEEAWLKAFTEALLADQKAFGIFCSGGDTTSIMGPLSISITAMGLVPEGKAVNRNGAQDGDEVILSGPVGDALIGLRILQGELESDDDYFFTQAYYRPIPRTDLAEIIREYAHAAIDVSDGLVADLYHICKASGVAAEIELNEHVFSEQACALIEAGDVSAQDLLGGGDDYVLALAVPADKVEAFLEKAPGAFRLGYFTGGEPGVSITDQDGETLTIEHTGWSHF